MKIPLSALLLAPLLVGALAASCGGDGTGGPAGETPGTQPDPVATVATVPRMPATAVGAAATVPSLPATRPTPVVLEAALQAALEEYAASQGWRLVGDCSIVPYLEPQAGYCYAAPQYADDLVRIAVVRTFSDFGYIITLESTADGSLVVTSVEENTAVP